MGMRELIAAVQPDVAVRIERHHVSRAIKSGYVRPVRRVGMAFDYSPDSVDGLREYLRTMRPWRRRYSRFA